MNCDRALELLLEAEPAELAIAVETPLVAHLRGCGRCAAVATRLGTQAAAMASVVSRERAGRMVRESAAMSARGWRWAPLGFAVAAALVLVVSTSGDVADGKRARNAVGAASDSATSGDPAALALASAAPAAPHSSRATSGDPEGGSGVGRAAAAVPHDASLASAGRYAPELMTAVAFESHPVDAPSSRSGEAVAARNALDSGVVSVAPPPGTQATIMRTSDPNVTVVWLQPADTTRIPE